MPQVDDILERNIRFKKPMGIIKAKENSEALIPWKMAFADFYQIYNQVMKAVAEKEKIGQLDPAASPYMPLSDEEKVLLRNDWKAFSRKRGFSEEDIAEYEIWLVLSGQQDGLLGAINDPWRRPRPHWERHLWLKHVELARSKGLLISKNVSDEYERLNKQAGVLMPRGNTVHVIASIVSSRVSGEIGKEPW